MQTRFFSALGWEMEEHNKIAKAKFALTCSFEKVIRKLAFTGRENFDNSFNFKHFDMV